jgi:hypothetical protein
MKHFYFPWVMNLRFDFFFIFLPVFFVLSLFLFFPNVRSETKELSTFSWVILVLCIDVSHVWSTLFRTYLHSENFNRDRNILLVIPFLVWIVGVIIYSLGGHYFWTFVAYLAVFHFIRQQYGFMRLYSRGENRPKIETIIDDVLIHILPLYPVVYWHTHLPRNFSWMMEGDFILGLSLTWERIFFFLYCISILFYLVKAIKNVLQGIPFNVPKNLLILSTALNWYVGIVYFNSDLAFTLTNVVAHGIPYLALIWSQEKKDQKRFLNWFSGFIFVGIILLFAYGEEALWAGFIWREHLEVFSFFSYLPEVSDSATLALLVPLLTVPQATHYVLDGIIWKKRRMSVMS